jgi:hypothetical protein
MNNKLILSLLVLAFGANVEAGMRNNNNTGTVVTQQKMMTIQKQPATAVVTKAAEEPIATLEEKHMVVTEGQKAFEYNMKKQPIIMEHLKKAIDTILKQNPNIGHSNQPISGAPSIVEYHHPGISSEAHAFGYMHERSTGEPIRLTPSGQKQHMVNMHQHFQKFVENNKALGVMCAGGTNISQLKWIVKYKNPNYTGKPGSGEWCYIFIKPTAQVTQEEEATLKMKALELQQEQ